MTPSTLCLERFRTRRACPATGLIASSTTVGLCSDTAPWRSTACLQTLRCIWCGCRAEEGYVWANQLWWRPARTLRRRTRHRRLRGRREPRSQRRRKPPRLWMQTPKDLPSPARASTWTLRGGPWSARKGCQRSSLATWHASFPRPQRRPPPPMLRVARTAEQVPGHTMPRQRVPWGRTHHARQRLMFLQTLVNTEMMQWMRRGEKRRHSEHRLSWMRLQHHRYPFPALAVASAFSVCAAALFPFARAGDDLGSWCAWPADTLPSPL